MYEPAPKELLYRKYKDSTKSLWSKNKLIVGLQITLFVEQK